MKEIEMISGFTVYIPNREYDLLTKMVHSKQNSFKRHTFTPRASQLADNLVQLHVLDRDDDCYHIRQFSFKD